MPKKKKSHICERQRQNFGQREGDGRKKDNHLRRRRRVFGD